MALRPLALQKDINRERIVNLQKKINYIQVTKKKWILLVLFILLVAGWFKFFYKTWTNESVPENADCIIALDVKKITNTLIWNFITTPSQWKSGDWFSSDEEGKVSWDDMISLPDYVFLFHLPGEPDNAFYTVVEINDKKDFEKGLMQYGFEKTATGSFISKETGIEFIRNGDQLLVGNAAIWDKTNLQKAAAALFVQKEVIGKSWLKNLIKEKSHFALSGMLFAGSHIFAGHYDMKANFDDESLHISVDLGIKAVEFFHSYKFSYSDTSMLSFGLTQPYNGFGAYDHQSAWQGISNVFNFSIDSLLLRTNKHYQLDVTGIYPRTDSAISYSYDDNFNLVEKVIVNKVEEPVFNFTVTGDSVYNIYDYWNRNDKLEKSGDSSLFTPIPFARAYCSLQSKDTLTIATNNYTKTAHNKTISCTMFLRFVITKAPSSLLNYLSPELVNLLKNIESVEAVMTAQKGQSILDIQFNKKKNDQPLVSF